MKRILEAGQERMTSLLVLLETRFQMATEFKQINKIDPALFETMSHILADGLKYLTSLVEKELAFNIQDLQTVKTLASFHPLRGSNDSGRVSIHRTHSH
jgi:hypothetical protein